MITTAPGRVLAATVTTVVAALLGLVVAVVGRARYLEDLCSTRAPDGADTPPERVVVSGPVADGLVGFRCEVESAPRYGFGFTDPLPLLWTCAVAAVVVWVAVLAWRWARRPVDR
ncbi:MAG TPA: hypothetical protein VFR56_02470 [Actinomycetes bacterium]|nr:hypothetical protein [Actinomycetes bacterium]